MNTIFTDGSCNFNKKGANNIGSYAYIIINESGNVITEKVVKVENTTNNRMELSAVIESLKVLKNKNEPVTVFTDSEYISNAVNKNWLKKWVKNNLQKKSGSDFVDIPNKDLWNELIPLLTSKVKIKWVRGHSGNVYNERCDELCRSVYSSDFKILH